jgi:hypothetical protein
VRRKQPCHAQKDIQHLPAIIPVCFAKERTRINYEPFSVLGVLLVELKLKLVPHSGISYFDSEMNGEWDFLQTMAVLYYSLILFVVVFVFHFHRHLSSSQSKDTVNAKSRNLKLSSNNL